MITNADKTDERVAYHSSYQYSAYGLSISCDVALDELAIASFEVPDLEIRCCSVETQGSLKSGDRVVTVNGDHIYLGLGGVAKFLIRGPGRIDYEPDPSFDLNLISLAILGPVMAMLLHLRGMLILHGSALLVDGRAVMFLGDKGAGKSTTASAMIAAGHRLLTDDVLAINFPTDGPPLVIPGYPQVKLANAAAAALTLPDHAVIPTDHPGFDKQRIRFTDSFDDRPTPVGAVYILSRGKEAAMKTLESGEALQALMRFSYIVRFGQVALRGEAAGKHLFQSAHLAGAIPVCELVVPDGLDRLSEAVGLVESHMAEGR